MRQAQALREREGRTMLKRVLLMAILSVPLTVAAPDLFADPAPPADAGRDPSYDDMKADTPIKSNAADEFATGANLVKQQQFSAAIPHLEAALAKKQRDVTVMIYLGFAHRMVGGASVGDAQTAEFKKALEYYQRGLAIDEDNKLLHEYLGKLYLLMREYALADDEMKTLETLCPSACAERAALTEAIAANPPPPTYVASPPPSH
jgi:tetratricopeptide (TPR) repeat protein